MSNIMIITDAWEPQVNGVVTTFKNTIDKLQKMGHVVSTITPNDFKYGFPCPSYPEIRVSVASQRAVRRLIKLANPDYIHIATEGSIGWQAMRVCEKDGLSFTTSYHTKMPEYVNTRFPFINPNWIYAGLRRLHRSSKCIMVTTESMKNELALHGFKNAQVWGRGVDLDQFTPSLRPHGLPLRLLYVGRVSPEKNIGAFLDCETGNAEKVVVGGGPMLDAYREQYKDSDTVQFLGYKKGKDLAAEYAKADVFVFPSKSDTFGIVMIEANACGTPVAAFPVTGPIDYVVNGVNGYLSNDLGDAIMKAAAVDRGQCATHAAALSWEACTETFYRLLTVNPN